MPWGPEVGNGIRQTLGLRAGHPPGLTGISPGHRHQRALVRVNVRTSVTDLGGIASMLNSTDGYDRKAGDVVTSCVVMCRASARG